MNKLLSRRGQSLAEFGLFIPILAVLLAAILEFGLAFDSALALEAASREGARISAVIGNGGTRGVCPNAAAEDAEENVVESIQASLSRGAVRFEDVRVTIYKADAFGNPAGPENTYTGGAGGFVQTGHGWPVCSRHDGTFGGGIYDAVGVRIDYTYRSATGLMGLFAGEFHMSARAVMPIGPPWR